MNRIALVSRRLRLTFWIMLIAAPFVTALFWLFFQQLPREILASNLPSALVEKLIFWVAYQDSPLAPSPSSLANAPLVTVNALSLALAFLADMIPTSVLMYVFYILTRLFRNYELGIIFSFDNSKLYRKLALSLFAKAIADCVYVVLAGLALTFQGPVGKRMLILEFGTTQFALIFIGFVVLLISWIMEEAFRLSEEQVLTI